MKFWWLFIPLWWATGAWAVPPDGMPFRVVGQVWSGSGVGLSGELCLVWMDDYDGWMAFVGPVAVEVTLNGAVVALGVSWDGGYAWNNTDWGGGDWIGWGATNGEPVGSSGYFAFLPTEVDYGIGTQLWPTLDMVWGGVGLAVILFFVASWVGVLLREIGILKRF